MATLSVGAGTLSAVSEADAPQVDVALAGEHADVRRAVELVGQILCGAVTSRASVEGFLQASLGRSGPDVVCESRKLSGIGHLTAGLALGALIDQFTPTLGPGDDEEPPTWGHVRVGDQELAPPAALAAYFPAGQLATAPVVVRICEHHGFTDGPRLMVYSRPQDRGDARSVLEAIIADAEGARNVFRGRALLATDRDGLVLEVTDPPAQHRSKVIVPQNVWSEIDLNIAALTHRRTLMSTLGLGVRRGVLLAGPPGVGKTAACQAIAAELVGTFTVITVDARAGQAALAGVYQEARTLGPTLVVLEDIDLIIGKRANSDKRVLSEFLAVMDTDPTDPILTIATTNDTAALDAAAIRSARFDSIIEIGYPTRQATAAILATYLNGVPGADHVDTDSVAAQLNPNTSGADIREIVRRTALSVGQASTAGLIDTIRSGRFRPQLPTGQYL